MNNNKILLTIAGMDYHLTTDEDVTYMKEIGEEVDEYITELMQTHPKLSGVQAAVLCALEYADRQRSALRTADHMKSQIQMYMEDASRAKTEAEMSRREVERMTRDLRSIRRSLEENDKI